LLDIPLGVTDKPDNSVSTNLPNKVFVSRIIKNPLIEIPDFPPNLVLSILKTLLHEWTLLRSKFPEKP
ncbi:hypothetical protein QP302_25900, partial [Escherichia coli]|nr:hypothetical protein [Escherichia coli]